MSNNALSCHWRLKDLIKVCQIMAVPITDKLGIHISNFITFNYQHRNAHSRILFRYQWMYSILVLLLLTIWVENIIFPTVVNIALKKFGSILIIYLITTPYNFLMHV